MGFQEIYDDMTPLDRAAYQLACQYNLGEFYQPKVGNIIVPDDEASRDVTNDILRFLVNNEDWMLGHEFWGTDNGYWFLTDDFS